MCFSVWTPFPVRPMSPTHHSDGEVVVHNAIRHRVASLVLVRGRDVNLPAIQHHLRAVLDVPHDLQQALALVACRKRRNIGDRFVFCCFFVLF